MILRSLELYLVLCTYPLYSQNNLQFQLDEANRNLIRLRAQAQANEVLGRQALREQSSTLKSSTDAIQRQNEEAARLVRQTAQDLQDKNTYVQLQLEAVKEESRKNVLEILGAQVFTFLTVIVGYLFNSFKEKRNHKWALEAEEARKLEFDNRKIEVDSRLDEISAILNHEKAPRIQWMHSSS